MAEVPGLHAPADQPSAIVQQFDRFVVPTYARSLVLVRGEGSYVWDESGRRYLDFGGGVAVNSLGHAHPAIAKAIAEQARTLIHTSNLYYHAKQGELAERLVRLTGPGKVFFCNSGAEANEAMFKLARRFGHDDGRFEVVTALQSFHGRTLAGIAATGQEKVRVKFGPPLPGFRHVPYNDLAAVEAAITPATAAVLIEGIQGEGGIIPARPDYLHGLRRLCDERGILLLMDAVQCGMFRTGRFQSYQRILEGSEEEAFLPDAIAMAKSLGGGIPIGAVWIRGPHADLLSPGSHGSTYGGTPLACAAALAVLETIESEKLAGNIRRQGDLLAAGLREHTASGNRILAGVRGFGGLLGLQVTQPAPGLVGKLREAGLLTVPAGQDIVRLLPALNITDAETQEALAILTRCL
jgi:acetylornithine aminotransferase/acetylornithine/N-succinyldiaminopimelate aminotransferase